jgi:hypothetical protein
MIAGAEKRTNIGETVAVNRPILGLMPAKTGNQIVAEVVFGNFPGEIDARFPVCQVGHCLSLPLRIGFDASEPTHACDFHQSPRTNADSFQATLGDQFSEFGLSDRQHL